VDSRTRIGAVSYLNTRPLVFGLERGIGGQRIELSYDVPSRLADRMVGGELDVALMPVIELARMPELEIVPGLAIGTFGPARSVMLVSRRPIEKVGSIALDAESRTSNALVQVLCDRVWRRSPRFCEESRGLDDALKECDAAVQIGDKALFADPPPGTVVYDLGGAWTAATGMPFVYAAWFAKPGAIDREIYEALHESRRSGVSAIDAIAEDYTWRGQRYPQTAREYLRDNIRFRLGTPELEGLRTFLSDAAALGLIGSPPEIKLALTRWTACHEKAATETRHAKR
jgi:chorismate dehydratase